MMLPYLAVILLALVDKFVVDIIYYMPDFNFLTNIFAKIFIVL